VTLKSGVKFYQREVTSAPQARITDK